MVKPLIIENKYTCSNIRQVVRENRIEKSMPGQAFHPKPDLLEGFGLDPALEHQELWKLWVVIQVGMDRRGSHLQIFQSVQEAEEQRDRYPVGTELNHVDEPWPIDFRKTFEKGFSASGSPFTAAGDTIDPEIYKCLYSADVIDEKYFKVSERVLNWAGPDRIAWAKAMEPENWACVLQLEYCTYHFPRSSLAYMAAQYQFNYFVVEDDHSAGYLQREIEMILGGAESLAEQVLNTRKKAGEAGRQASKSAKLRRLAMFLDEIEKLSELVGRISEGAIVDQAFQNAIENDQSLWRQGRGQQAEYETALRSEPEYQQRYFKVFNQIA